MRINGEERIQIAEFHTGVLRGPISSESALGALMHRQSIDPTGDPSTPPDGFLGSGGDVPAIFSRLGQARVGIGGSHLTWIS